MNINEVARRVGVDASPVRTHLELLLKAGLVKEIDSTSGRERKFESPLTGVQLVLKDVHKPKLPSGELPKAAQRVQKKLELIARDIGRLEEKARRYQDELKKALLADLPKEKPA